MRSRRRKGVLRGEKQYHGDAPGQADEHEAGSQAGFVWEERPRETELERRDTTRQYNS